MASKRSHSKSFLITVLLLFVSANALAAKRYVVEKGDTLYDLAKKFGVSIQTIKRANGLSNNRLYINDVLSIPDADDGDLSLSQIRYEVVKGDTLIGIGRKFGVPLLELKHTNYLASDRLIVGQYLIIPNPLHDYLVQRGDTLIGIGKRFGVSVGDIKSTNGLTSSNIKIGMNLTIPGAISTAHNFGEDNEYVVKRGDNLSLLAQRFGVPVTDIKRANDITGTIIRVGQALAIPYGDDGRYDIIEVAERFLGAPYKFGGTSTVKGIDCSAFVNKVFDYFEVDLPRTAREIYKVGQYVDRSELAVGDLVFFETYASFPSHVGIYVGNGKFIHASSRAKRVTVNSIDERYYRSRYIGAKRIEARDL
jgi:Cell wall-associated hydrolases (invasion-associated proteins)